VSLRKEFQVPTHVVFAKGKAITLEEDFDKVNAQLSQVGAGLFNALLRGNRSRRVTVHQANVLYIEDYEGVTEYAQ